MKTRRTELIAKLNAARILLVEAHAEAFLGHIGNHQEIRRIRVDVETLLGALDAEAGGIGRSQEARS